MVAAIWGGLAGGIAIAYFAYDLPDVVRWRNYVDGARSVATAPLDSIERAVRHDNFRIHLESAGTCDSGGAQAGT